MLIVWVPLILITKLGIWVLHHGTNLEAGKPGWLTGLEKYSLLSSMWLDKLEKNLVEYYIASVSIFYFMLMYW